LIAGARCALKEAMRLAYTPLSIEDFGRHLLTSQDLDPIYVALVGAKFEPRVLRRWLMVYWCCYDAGVSCYIAEASSNEEFWRRMLTMAANGLPSPLGGRWRRAAERRHWRGANAARSLADLETRYANDPEAMADYCARGADLTSASFRVPCADIMKRAQEHIGFGPWIAFKIADMSERVLKYPTSFDKAEVFMFKDPMLAARMAFADHNNTHAETTEKAVAWAIQHLANEFKDMPAPPGWDRPVGLQEIETILCKWKSHVNGHYPLNKDLIEIRHHLEPWKRFSLLARAFGSALPA